jgi:DNA replication protein DnaC
MTAECAEAFETFWKLYPRKTAKDNARKAFAKINPNAELLAEIMASLAKHATCQAWLKDDGQFIPHAATWLNGKRWNDEVKAFSAAPRLRVVNGPDFHSGDTSWANDLGDL